MYSHHEYNPLNPPWFAPFGLPILDHRRSPDQPVGEWCRPEGALPDIIEHERAGVIVKPGEVEGLTSAIGAPSFIATWTEAVDG
jgi:hypothetical protein